MEFIKQFIEDNKAELEDKMPGHLQQLKSAVSTKPKNLTKRMNRIHKIMLAIASNANRVTEEDLDKRVRDSAREIANYMATNAAAKKNVNTEAPE